MAVQISEKLVQIVRIGPDGMAGIPFLKFQVVNEGLRDVIQYRVLGSVSNLSKKEVVLDDLFLYNRLKNDYKSNFPVASCCL